MVVGLGGGGGGASDTTSGFTDSDANLAVWNAPVKQDMKHEEGRNKPHNCILFRYSLETNIAHLKP